MTRSVLTEQDTVLPTNGSLRRTAPGELIAVTVLGVATGIAEMIVGALVIFARYADSIAHTRIYAAVTILGASLVLLGLLTAAVASGLLRGDRAARIICSVLLALGLAGHIATVLLAGSDTRLLAAITGLLSAAAIVVMWTGRASRWFGRPIA